MLIHNTALTMRGKRPNWLLGVLIPTSYILGGEHMEKEKLPECPVEITLTLISSKWKLLIIRDLLRFGTMRFGELTKSIEHVSKKVLTENLRSMEEDGLLNRTVYPVVPPKVEYSLTAKGKSLQLVIDALFLWGEKYKNNEI